MSDVGKLLFDRKKLGKIRSEGKEYTVQDGEVIEFRIGESGRC